MILNALNNIVFQNHEWEEFIKNVRFNFLKVISKNKLHKNKNEKRGCHKLMRINKFRKFVR